LLVVVALMVQLEQEVELVVTELLAMAQVHYKEQHKN